MQMMRLLLIFTLVLTQVAHGQPLQKPKGEELWVEGYKVEITELFANKRIVLADTLLCMGEYEYSLVAGYIEDSAVDLDVKVSKAKAERDEICEESKQSIRSRCTSVESKLRLDLKLATERFNFTKTKLSESKAAHDSDLKHHYVVEAVLSTALLGVIGALFVK